MGHHALHLCFLLFLLHFQQTSIPFDFNLQPSIVSFLNVILVHKRYTNGCVCRHCISDIGVSHLFAIARSKRARVTSPHCPRTHVYLPPLKDSSSWLLRARVSRIVPTSGYYVRIIFCELEIGPSLVAGFHFPWYNSARARAFWLQVWPWKKLANDTALSIPNKPKYRDGKLMIRRNKSVYPNNLFISDK